MISLISMGKNLTGISILKKIWCFQIEDMAIYYSAMRIFEFLQHIKKKRKENSWINNAIWSYFNPYTILKTILINDFTCQYGKSINRYFNIEENLRRRLDQSWFYKVQLKTFLIAAYIIFFLWKTDENVYIYGHKWVDSVDHLFLKPQSNHFGHRPPPAKTPKSPCRKS